MSPTSMKPNRWSLLTSQTRRNRSSLIYLATSRHEEAYPCTGQKSIPSVTSPIYRSWKEKNGFVGSFQLSFAFLTPSQQLAATKKHLTDLVKIYGEQTLVNLIDHKGYEQPVKEVYEKYFNQVEMPRQNVPLSMKPELLR